MMHLSCKPDFEAVYARYDAFWNRAVLDRPPVSITLYPPKTPPYFPQKKHASWQAYWLDTEYRTNLEVHRIENTQYLYDALPIAWPNLGPGIFSSFFGCGYTFGETTAWTTPVIEDWRQDLNRYRLRVDHPMFQALLDYTRKLIERGRGRFIVGLTDFHPGADHLVAMRGADRLAMDLIDDPYAVRCALESYAPVYKQVYNVFYEMLRAEDMPITSWIPLVNEYSYYIPSCDFSALVSPKMFERHFLPGIADECAFLDRSVYHLDGPGALPHLDALLSIDALDAVQWVPGAGNEGFARWAATYQKIQRADKSLVLYVRADELSLVFETLSPEGVFFDGIRGIESREEAAEIIKRIKQWK